MPNYPPTQPTPLLYVCVISTFNIPEFESCLLHKPSNVFLIVSNDTKIKSSATRFARELQKILPETSILRSDKLADFNGASFADTAKWVNNYLLPELNKYSMPRACNITGGTKAITLVLSNFELKWNWLDYKGEGEKGLQVLKFNQDKNLYLADKITSLPTASPLSVAGLSNESVEELKPNPLSNKGSYLAQKTWEALRDKDEALLGLFGDATHGLARIWAYGRNNKSFNKKQLSLTAQDFLLKDEFSSQELAWLKAWSELAPESLSFSNTSITLPGNRSSNSLRRWISGDWLELLVMDWLAVKIPNQHFVANLKINPLEQAKQTATSLGEREADLVIHFREQTSVIEIKTNLPPNGSIRDLLQQITSLRNRLGRTNKILFIGPQLWNYILDKNDLDKVELRAEADGVQLAYDQETLFKSLNL